MKKIIALLAISCFVLPQMAFGGAWTLTEDHVWMELYGKANWAKYDFGADREKHAKNNGARSWGWAFNPKVEYGVKNWFTLLGGVEYKEAQYKEYACPANWGPYSVKNHGVTSVDFGARARLLEKPVVISGQIKGFLNTRRGYDLHRQPGISDGNDALELRGLIGKKFNTKIPYYVGAESGYRFNNRDMCNYVPFFLEGGFWPIRWFLVKSEIDGVLCHDGTGKTEKEYAIWRIGPVFHLLSGNDITRQGKALDVALQYGLTFWGRNTSADQEFVIKVSAQF